MGPGPGLRCLARQIPVEPFNRAVQIALSLIRRDQREGGALPAQGRKGPHLAEFTCAATGLKPAKAVKIDKCASRPSQEAVQEKMTLHC